MHFIHQENVLIKKSVKIIGATNHYVATILNFSAIINQNVTRVAYILCKKIEESRINIEASCFPKLLNHL